MRLDHVLPVQQPTRRPSLRFMPQEGYEEKWTLARCGHRLWLRDRLMVDDMQDEVDEHNHYNPGLIARIIRMLRPPEHCRNCQFESRFATALRCVLCGRPILQGDGVALYNYTKGLKRNAFAPGAGITTCGFGAIGCMRMNCATGGAYAGMWSGKDVICPSMPVIVY